MGSRDVGESRGIMPAMSPSCAPRAAASRQSGVCAGTWLMLLTRSRHIYRPDHNKSPRCTKCVVTALPPKHIKRYKHDHLQFLTYCLSDVLVAVLL